MFEETIWVMQYVETKIMDQLPAESVSQISKDNRFVPMEKVIDGKKNPSTLFTMLCLIKNALLPFT